MDLKYNRSHMARWRSTGRATAARTQPAIRKGACGSAHGVVTFLLTDVVGSSSHWERSPDSMRKALERHDRLITWAVQQSGGTVLTTHGEGDSFFAVFPLVSRAVGAAYAIQCRLRSPTWPDGLDLQVRIALHSGEAEGDYRGRPANRCARVRALAQGHQTLLTGVAAHLAREALHGSIILRDLGWHVLRDLGPEQIFQLVGISSR